MTKPSSADAERGHRQPGRAEQDPLGHRARRGLRRVGGVERDEVVHQQRRGVVARVGIRRERLVDHPQEVVSQVGAAFGERLAPAADVGLDDLVERAAFDGMLAGQQVIEQDADAVDVALHRGAAAPASTSGAM